MSTCRRFIALPVSAGDAFFLDLGHHSVLVDGGRNRTAFPGIFRSYACAAEVDVVVCTHNDADHANGILGFLDESSLRCKELWLPGRWLAVLPHLLCPREEVFNSLVDTVGEAEPCSHETGLCEDPAPQNADPSPLEWYYNEKMVRCPGASRDRDSGQSGGEVEWSRMYADLFDRADPWESADNFRQDPPRTWRRRVRGGAGGAAARIHLLRSAFRAARRIRNIVIRASRRHIRVRWFEFNEKRPGGGEAWLRPLNAREVTAVPRLSEPLLSALALTVANRESLVFWAPSANRNPGVLFTADSNLSATYLPPQAELDGAVATAPHHGSDANKHVYRILKNYPLGARVRSDGRFSRRPGGAYVSLPQQHFCTICRLSGNNLHGNYWSKKHEVFLLSCCGVWHAPPATPACLCR